MAYKLGFEHKSADEEVLDPRLVIRRFVPDDVYRECMLLSKALSTERGEGPAG